MKRGTFTWDALKLYWERRYGCIRFRLMDINCMGYLGLIGILLIFFHKTVIRWPFHVLIHAAFVIGILEIVRLGEKYPHIKILWVLRTFYPMTVILYGWSEIDALVRMFFGTYWSTDAIIHLDKLIFRVHPTVWVQQFYRPWLDELMNIFYSGYHLIMPLFSLILFTKGKREETLAAFSIVTATYFSNFFLFYLLPTLAPLMTDALRELHTNQYTGYIAAEITRTLHAIDGQRCGAFPSCHISTMLVWFLIALRYKRKLGYVSMPMALGVGISTVYLGYHHAVDPICGYIWGALCYPIALKLIKIRGEDPLTALSFRHHRVL